MSCCSYWTGVDWARRLIIFGEWLFLLMVVDDCLFWLMVVDDCLFWLMVVPSVELKLTALRRVVYLCSL